MKATKVFNKFFMPRQANIHVYWWYINIPQDDSYSQMAWERLLTMKNLLLLTNDAQLVDNVAQLHDYDMTVSQNGAYKHNHFPVILVDISTMSHVTAPVLDEIEQSCELLLIIADVSEQEKLAQFGIADDYLLKPLHPLVLRKRLDAIASQSQEVSQYKDDMRHGLKNPLASILGYADLMLESLENPQIADNLGTLTDKQAKFMTSISNAARKMLLMIDEVPPPEYEAPQ